MEIITFPNNFAQNDDLDRIFIYLDGNINQDLINYLSNNIKNYQIKFTDKIVIFYSQTPQSISQEQNNELIQWKKNNIYQSDIIVSFITNSENNDLIPSIEYFYETYKKNISNHYLIVYNENKPLFEEQIKKASNNSLIPILFKDIKEVGNLILEKIEKLYLETNYSSIIPNKLKTIRPGNKVDFNIGILGKYNTGNFSIWHWSFKGRYIRFFERFGPGTDGMTYEVNVKNKNYIIDFQFPAGQQKFDSDYLSNRFILNKNCFIFVFDITNRASFDDIKNKYYINAKKLDIKVKHFWVLVGNKSDLRYKRKVSYEEANTFAKEKNMEYFEVSVKSGDNMEKLFDYIYLNLVENN